MNAILSESATFLQGSQGAPGAAADWRGTGVVLPERLTTHGAVAAVLNQESGRLRITDMKGAIAAKRAAQAAVDKDLQMVEQRAAAAGVDALDNCSVAAAVKVRAQTLLMVFRCVQQVAPLP